MNEIKLKSCATVANLSCGFDILGLCLNEPYDEITITKTDAKKVILNILDSKYSDIPKNPSENTGGVPAELILNDLKLKLTEKEINTIIYISKSNKPVSIDELQEKVWSYQSDIETHTVETHIYRLRKKILNKFDDNKFIISKKNGYQIK